jgi:hypothetical protein
MRKYYGDIVYIWTIEVQEERAEKYDDRVLHWHIMIGFDYDIEFGKDDIIRIQRYWKYGNVDVKPVRKPNMGYLMKYITKSLDSPIESAYKVRKIGSSRIWGYLRQSWTKLSMAIRDLMAFGIGPDAFQDFKWCRKGCYDEVEGDEKRVLLSSGGLRLYRKRLYLFTFPPSPWYKYSDFEREAFLRVYRTGISIYSQKSRVAIRLIIVRSTTGNQSALNNLPKSRIVLTVSGSEK